MTQDEKWRANWREVMDFMEANKRRPSKFIPEERGMKEEVFAFIEHANELVESIDKQIAPYKEFWLEDL